MYILEYCGRIDDHLNDKVKLRNSSNVSFQNNYNRNLVEFLEMKVRTGYGSEGGGHFGPATPATVQT
jgi:hypothetical protein